MIVEYLIIKEENEYCNSKETFISLLKSNSTIGIGEKEIRFDGSSTRYTLETDSITANEKNERYFILKLIRNVSGNTQTEDALDILTKTSKAIKKVLADSDFKFRLVTIWDDVSAHYAAKAYPLLNEIENLMRKLISKFMLINIGMKWIEEAAPGKFQEAIKKKSTKDALVFLDHRIFEADFIQLNDFLFTEYSKADFNQLSKTASSAKRLADFKLKDLKELKSLSNWDRYFSKFVKIDNLKDKWKELYDLRNSIAHNKPITKTDFERIDKLTNDIKKAIEKVVDDEEKLKLPKETHLDFEEWNELISSDPSFNYFKTSFKYPVIPIIKGQKFMDIIKHSKQLKDINVLMCQLGFLNDWMNQQKEDTDEKPEDRDDE